MSLNKYNDGPYRIGISCIGSGVGQSVVNSLRLSGLPLYTVGLGTNPLAYGAYECDSTDQTPGIYDKGYFDELISKCRAHRIDLIIPGHDDEVLLYAQNADRFASEGIRAIFPDRELVEICRDKERMSRELSNAADVFVKSFDPENTQEALDNGVLNFPFIAKPRAGYASRGIEIIRGREDLVRITEDHIVQELAIPSKKDPNRSVYMNQLAAGHNPQVSEVSVQLVYGTGGNLLGRMCTWNKLSNGIPIEILPLEDEYLWSVIDRLTPELLKRGLCGPLNIQGRLTDEGLKIFEMNPRFTGITGLRALMGFNEVEACVKEWLGINAGKNQITYSFNRFGIRQTADKSLAFDRSDEARKLSEQIHQRVLPARKTVLLTGSTGYLGRLVAERILSEKEKFRLITLDRDAGNSAKIQPDQSVDHFSYYDLLAGKLTLGNIDVLLHLGFARPHCTTEEVADSLANTVELFTRAAMSHVPLIVNISSQSVYGTKKEPLWNESTPPAPETHYGQAKYAVELLLKSFEAIYPHEKHTSIRLCAIEGGSDGLVETGFLPLMTRQGISGQNLRVLGGNQRMERLDVRDAADALVHLIDSPVHNIKRTYNLGSGTYATMLEIAGKIADITASLTGRQKMEVLVDTSAKELKSFGMSSDLFYNDFGWRPQYRLEETIHLLATYLMNKPRT